MITLRKFLPGDAEICTKIKKENFLLINSKHYTPDTIKALLFSWTEYLLEKAQKRTYYVAEENHEVIGMWWYENNEIHTFFVDPQKHGAGIGKKIMEQVLSDMKNNGISKAICRSTDFAEKFYQSCGFKTIGRETIEFQWAPLPYILMEKELS